jgi:hypothetical protein
MCQALGAWGSGDGAEGANLRGDREGAEWNLSSSAKSETDAESERARVLIRRLHVRCGI